MGLLERARWEQDAAGRLLVFDFSNTSPSEAEALFELFDTTVRAEPAGSVRVLADFEGAYHAPDLVRRWKSASAAHDRQIRMAALTGVHGGLKLVVSAYRLYLRLRGIDVEEKMRLFDGAAEARAWLAQAR
jgi:hypothetical protein